MNACLAHVKEKSTLSAPCKSSRQSSLARYRHRISAIVHKICIDAVFFTLRSFGASLDQRKGCSKLISATEAWDAGRRDHHGNGRGYECVGSVSQLASWAGICPGNNESGGQRKSSRVPKGNVYLKTALEEAANAAAKAKGTYLRDKFYRLKARRGYKRAAVAVAHKILAAIYPMFSHQVCYHELGDLYLDKLDKHHLTRNLVHRLERLGYTVTLEQKAA
jgi:hypothetical protein